MKDKGGWADGPDRPDQRGPAELLVHRGRRALIPVRLAQPPGEKEMVGGRSINRPLSSHRATLAPAGFVAANTARG